MTFSHILPEVPVPYFHCGPIDPNVVLDLDFSMESFVERQRSSVKNQHSIYYITLMGDTSHCTVILAALHILPACKIVILSCFLTAISAIFCSWCSQQKLVSLEWIMFKSFRRLGKPCLIKDFSSEHCRFSPQMGCFTKTVIKKGMNLTWPVHTVG